MNKISVLLLCIFLAGCSTFPNVKFFNQSGQDLEISSGDLSFRLESMETSQAFNLAAFFRFTLEIKNAECAALYSADVPTAKMDIENATGVARDWLGDYWDYSARVIISPTFELQLEITHKKRSSVHIIEAFGFPAKPEKLTCAGDD